jgi:hypothetical protein
MSDNLVASLKATLDKAERYALTSLASSVAFAILSFPEAVTTLPGQPVKWQLLGFPLDFQPVLALVVLYCIYIISCVLADNLLIHVGEITGTINNRALVAEVLTHPTVLTVSPIACILATAFTSVLVIAGLLRIWWCGDYGLPTLALVLAGAFALGRVIVFVRVRQHITPQQNP